MKTQMQMETQVFLVCFFLKSSAVSNQRQRVGGNLEKFQFYVPGKPQGEPSSSCCCYGARPLFPKTTHAFTLSRKHSAN